ncbi:hypothetical protein AB0K52_15365 [Glycomyces sp. NPDC049804]|uniref:hypothetical protein n=1 Tax=Glycomyces sp. NPDC049804 TaxID=3154363 RepID=UPI0034258CB5
MRPVGRLRLDDGNADFGGLGLACFLELSGGDIENDLCEQADVNRLAPLDPYDDRFFFMLPMIETYQQERPKRIRHTEEVSSFVTCR